MKAALIFFGERVAVRASSEFLFVYLFSKKIFSEFVRT